MTRQNQSKFKFNLVYDDKLFAWLLFELDGSKLRLQFTDIFFSFCTNLTIIFRAGELEVVNEDEENKNVEGEKDEEDEAEQIETLNKESQKIE